MFALVFLATLFTADSVFAYTVEKGDTMSEIARENGLTLQELAEANPQIKNLDLIIVGQVINTDIDLSSSEVRMQNELPNATSNDSSKESQNIDNEKETSSKSLSLSDYEIDLLARIVRAEAQTEPFEGKVAVANVVLNRVESPKFPNTIKGVIYQRRQFQPVANGQINKPADPESIRAVHAALTNMRNIAGDSLFFYNPTIATSRWLDSRKTAVVIGQHVFKY
ncbi:LysM peptidoglycan-binding domain-containing protein [Bacillus mesophilus]|uniref:LysM peptidoglycan-binding domain-containing protein n=2 Tax=Bacillus mesophilus TaxID=1808955 RepID=A0A6M0QB42_9BACI|nr:cell wall hydrolase [Bacillus mesophilus]NEY72770.1 LysM peptidoglycan-binding domain-containing protein [Bacillus mesophilus]